MAEVTEQKLADYEARLKHMEEVVGALADAVIRLESILNEIGEQIVPGFDSESGDNPTENH